MLECLNKIAKSKIITSPYPHIVIDSFLNESLLNNLHNELRSIDMSSEIVNKNNNEIKTDGQTQYGTRNILQKDLDVNLNLKNSAKVNHFFSSKNFKESIVKKLSGYLKSCSGLEEELILEMLENKSNDSRIAFLPPSDSSKKREIHLDSSKMILVFLYYVRLPEDYSFGGSLNLLSREERYLFKSKINSLVSDLLNIYPSDLNIEKTYDYTDNRLVVMCSHGYSWHEVSTRRYATTARITFHGGIANDGKNNKLTLYGQDESLARPLKKKLKNLIGFLK